MIRESSVAALLWLALCAVYVGLGVFGVGSGLWGVAPYIAALTIARATEPRPGLRRGLRTAAVAGATGAIVVGVAVGIGREHVLGAGSGDTARLVTVAAFSLAAAGILTLACAVRPVRQRLFPRVGLDPASAVHATAAVLYATTLVVMAGSFVLLYDDPGETIPIYLSDPVVSLLTDVPLALAGVGWLMTRNFSMALGRLGFVPITRRQVAWAGVVAAAFVVAAGLLDHVEGWLLPEIYEREGRFSLKFANVSPWLGAPLVAVAAGVGEEAVFRGAMQPRFGVPLTALLFAAVHVQYEIPGIILIFLIGVVLGVLRDRTSTTFTALAHMLYDIAAFLIPDA